MSLVSKAFSDIITFSRSSNATRIGPDGKVQYAPHNLLTYSQQFDNADWTKVDSSVTANALAAPDGTITADKLVASAAGPTVHLLYQYRSVGASNTGTVSVYAKSAGYEYLALSVMQGSNSSGILYTFSLTDGTANQRNVGGYTNVSASAVNVGNGWWRCSITFTNASATADYVLVAPSPTATPSFNGSYNSASFTGDGTSGIYLWGAQLSVGSIAGDYTPTTSAAVYGPRFDYDPVTLAAKGLLIEEQRANLVTYSEQFDNAAWSKEDLTVTTNAATAPDGTVTADLILPSTYSADHSIYEYKAGSGSQTFSVYAKAGGYNYIFVGFNNTVSSDGVFFDLSTGAVSQNTSGLVASISNAGNGWYRCSVTKTSGFEYAMLCTSANGTSLIYAGNGTSGIYLWGAQLEAGSFATSYLPTLASSVTRSADVASVNTLSPWYSSTEGTLFAEYSFYGADSAYNNTSVMIADGTENNYIAIFGYSSAYGWVQASGATSAGLTVGGTTAINTTYKAAIAYKTNDFAFSLSGISPATDLSGAVPTVTSMLLGRRVSGSKPLHGHLRRVAVYPRRLTNAELQALTA